MTTLLSPPVRAARRLSPATTSQRVRMLTAAVAVLAGVLGVVVAQGVASVRGGLQDIGHRAGPQVVATADMHVALNNMDAQVANVLLVGDEHALGIDRAQALATYEQRRRQADADLQQAATVGAGDPKAQQAIRATLDALGQYEALTAQAILVDGDAHHTADEPPANALALYRQATDLLKTRLLPAAAGLTNANSDALEQTYGAKRTHAEQTAVGTALAGLAVLGALIALQALLARRFRRRFNPFLLLATLATGILVIAGVSRFTTEAEHFRQIKKDAFDSVLALSQARAISYDANADESRYLVDPARRQQYEQSFLAKMQQLATLPSVRTLPEYPAALRQAWSAYFDDNTKVRWKGYLGTEFRNITFPGERHLAELTMSRFLGYLDDDPRMRNLFQQGNVIDAVWVDTASLPSGSNYDFQLYDKSLASLINLNYAQFAKSVRAGEDDVSGWNLIPWAVVIAVVGLAVAGVRPRLAEYR